MLLLISFIHVSTHLPINLFVPSFSSLEQPWKANAVAEYSLSLVHEKERVHCLHQQPNGFFTKCCGGKPFRSDNSYASILSDSQLHSVGVAGARESPPALANRSLGKKDAIEAACDREKMGNIEHGILSRKNK